MSWLGSDRRTVIGKLPDIAQPWLALEQSLWTQPHLPASILELCRLRLAQLHRCDAGLARREGKVDEGQRDALASWESSQQFSDAERACLAFAEVYAMDAQALTDEHAEAVKAHFGDAGLVLLVEALGLLDGMTRLSLLWQLDAEEEERQ